MRINMVGAFVRNVPYGSEIAFKKGFERLGHEVAVIDQDVPGHFASLYTDPDFTLIFKTGKEYNEQLARLPGPKIVYQPDDFRFSHIQQMMKEMRSVCDYALTFDDDGAKEVIKDEYGYKAAQTLLLTADDELYRYLGYQRDLDFVFVGSLGGQISHASRRKMITLLSGAGYKVTWADGMYNIEKLVEAYNRAKVVLNHATDVGQKFGTGYGYQCRHFEVGMTKTPLLSNTILSDTGAVKAGPQMWIRYYDEKSLLDWAGQMIEDAEMRARLADDLYDEIRRKHMPEHRAEEIIQFVKNL